MDSKKGNVVGVLLIFIFFISSFVGIVLSYTRLSNERINLLNNEFYENRKEEQEIYNFYINKIYENEKYIQIDNIVYLFNDNTVKLIRSDTLDAVEGYADNNFLQLVYSGTEKHAHCAVLRTVLRFHTIQESARSDRSDCGNGTRYSYN